MSEKQETFTQGPWHYSEVIKGQDQYYRQIRADFKIAEVHACHSGVAGTKEGRAEDEANARLIAAAPEMYEVLKEIFRLSEIGLSNGILYGKKLVTEMGTENIPTHEKVRAILAKVKGETA